MKNEEAKLLVENDDNLWKELYKLLDNYIDDCDHELNIEVIKYFQEYDFYFFIKLAPYEYVIINGNNATILNNEKVYNEFEEDFFVKNFNELENLNSGKYHFYTIASTQSRLEKSFIVGDMYKTILHLFGEIELANFSKPLIPKNNIFEDIKVSEKTEEKSKTYTKIS